MPASYHIHPDARFVHTCATGILTGGEMVAHAVALAADPAFARGYSQFTDFRPVTDFEATPDDIRELAARNPFDREARRVALVGTTLAFGMLRMYQILSEIEDASSSLVTRDETEAWTFLGLSPDVVGGAAASAWTSDAAAG